MTRLATLLPTLGLLCAAVLHPSATALADDPSTWPVADGNFTSPGDPGWIFFKPTGFDGGCGIGPDGTVGCDIVPGSWAGQPGHPGSYDCEGQRCPLPPPGATQTVVSSQAPAGYIQSGSRSFTRDVGILPLGHRLINGNAWCSLSEQATIRCVSGANGFTLNSTYGILD